MLVVCFVCEETKKLLIDGWLVDMIVSWSVCDRFVCCKMCFGLWNCNLGSVVGVVVLLVECCNNRTWNCCKIIVFWMMYETGTYLAVNESAFAG